MRRAILALLVVLVTGAGCAARDTGDGTGAAPGPGAAPATPAGTGAPGTTAPDQDLCRLLTPEDFSAVAGLTVTDPAEHSYYDSPTDAYCVYGPDEDAPEVDIFVLPPEVDPQEVYQTVLAAGPVAVGAEGVVPGTDESAYGTIESIDGVGVSLRRGSLVAALSVAADVPDARAKLVALAELLLERAAGLGVS
jgi:hypothetical protein